MAGTSDRKKGRSDRKNGRSDPAGQTAINSLLKVDSCLKQAAIASKAVVRAIMMEMLPPVKACCYIEDIIGHNLDVHTKLSIHLHD